MAVLRRYKATRIIPLPVAPSAQMSGTIRMGCIRLCACATSYGEEAAKVKAGFNVFCGTRPWRGSWAKAACFTLTWLRWGGSCPGRNRHLQNWRMDKYASYRELAVHETEGTDYVILAREGPSSVAIIAPHGGGIEPGTADIADAVAADQHAFAAFKGIKKTGNADLHIRSDRFDEPTAIRAAKQAHMVVTIHGCRGQDERVYVGGRNADAKIRVIDALNRAGFPAQESLKPGLRGRSRHNICNRCRTGQGVQIEISKGLREKMFEGLAKRSVRKKTDMFYRFVRTLRDAIDA